MNVEFVPKNGQIVAQVEPEYLLSLMRQVAQFAAFKSKVSELMFSNPDSDTYRDKDRVSLSEKNYIFLIECKELLETL